MQTLEINPQGYRKDVAYIGCLSLWALGLFGIAVLCFIHEIWIGVYFALGCALLSLGLAIAQGTKIQTLVIGDDLAIFENRRQDPTIRVSKSKPIALTLEHVDSGGDSVDATATLNLWYSDDAGRHRYILGLWVSEKAKKELMRDVHNFLIQGGFEVSSDIK